MLRFIAATDKKTTTIPTTLAAPSGSLSNNTPVNEAETTSRDASTDTFPASSPVAIPAI